MNWVHLFLLHCVVLLAGCSEIPASRVLRVATTTSTRDSGLLDELLPKFEDANDCRVDLLAVGSGAALKLGEAGDADVLLVHARQAELDFMAAEHGIRREEFMYNEFVLLGPASDPGSIRALAPHEALRRIASQQLAFVSRGDDSGTHKREVQLWEENGGRPTWNEFRETGQGMGSSLIIADEKESYILSDMGTYLKFRDKISLVPLSTKSLAMRNPYSAIVVNPRKHEQAKETLADSFVDFLLSRKVQQQIADYQIDGQRLFVPTRLDSVEENSP